MFSYFPIIVLLHVLAAVLACFRLIEIVTMDRILARIRKKYAWYIWTCPRCVSVWAGIACTSLFILFPWANWPLALSWLYLWHIDNVLAKRLKNEPRQIRIEVDQKGNVQIPRSDFNPQDLAQIIKHLASRIISSPQPQQPQQAMTKAIEGNDSSGTATGLTNVSGPSIRSS